MKTSPFPFLKLFVSFTFILILQFIASHPANAQISITKSTVEAVFQGEYEVTSSISEDFVNIKPLYDNTGADRVWDFTTLSYDENFTSNGTFELSTNLAGAPLSDDPHFEQATHIIMAEFVTDTLSFSFYSYQIFNENELILLGSVMIEEGETDPDFVNYYRPGDIEYQFPATFGDSWDFEYEDDTSFGGFSESSDVSVTVEIEGWGKVITDEGESDVLRIMRTETTTLAGFEFKTFEVLFVEENGIEVATISGMFDLFGDGVEEESFEASISSFSEGATTSEERISELPRRLQLNQNYPNPFNPSTQITYQLNSPEQVTLSVYSLTGQKVQTLVNGEMKQAGSHTISFDAENLASGVYVYRLQTGSQSLTRKMTLLK